MKTEQIQINYKSLSGTKKTFSLNYTSPESLEEAIEQDTDSLVLKRYLQYRLIKFRDSVRTKKETEQKKAFAQALEKDSPEILAAKKLLGLA